MHKFLLNFSVLSQLIVGCGSSSNLPWQKKPEVSKAAPEELAEDAELPPRIEDLPEGLSTLTNLADLVAETGVNALHKQGYYGKGIKIAVLDNGFTGISHSAGVRLPPGVRVEDAPKSQQQNTTHGTKIAEITYAMATGNSNYVGKD